MTSSVIQLQELASDSKNNLSDVLRKALIISNDLGLNDFKKWISEELEGYKDSSNIPEYRIIDSQLKAINPFRGYIPFIVEDEELAITLSRIPVLQSVEELQNLIINSSTNSSLRVPFAPEHMARIMQISNAPLEPVRIVGKNQIAGLLNNVRNKLLGWSMNLKSEGILGEDLKFSDKERKKATNIFNITEFRGNLAFDGNISQNISKEIVPNDFDSLAKNLEENGIDKSDIKKLQSAISNDPEIKKTNELGPNVRKWMGNMITKTIDRSWNMGIDSAGSFLNKVILKYYDLI